MKRLVLLLGILALPATALAASVFLNGVNIDGVKNKVFNDCTVQIDGAGNIYIIEKSQPGKKPPTQPVKTGGKPTRRYWLVTEKAAPGMTQYDIDLFINSKWVRRFLDREEHVVMELTKHLQAGKNKIHLIAKKSIKDTRRSSSPQHYFRIVIGEGNSRGRNVMISKKMIDYKRTALETKNFTDQFELVAE